MSTADDSTADNSAGYKVISNAKREDLRDFFAAAALVGILASPTRMGEEAADNAAKAADWAYVYANAMLAEREKKQ